MVHVLDILFNVVGFAAALIAVIIGLSDKTKQRRYSTFNIAIFVMVALVAWRELLWEHHEIRGTLLAVGAAFCLVSAIKYWNRNPFAKRSNGSVSTK